MGDEYKKYVKSLRLHNPFKGLTKEQLKAVKLAQVGASNPYALASFIAFKKDRIIITWEDYVDNPDGAQALLTEYLGSAYETLFDPSSCPMLYIGGYPMSLASMKPLAKGEGWPDRGFIFNSIQENMIRAAVKETVKKKGKEKEGTYVAVPAVSRAFISDIMAERIWQQRRASFVPVESHVVIMPGKGQELMIRETTGIGIPSPRPGQHNIWDDVPNTYFTRISGSMNKFQDNQDDIIQGALPDCYLLASLAAWCWFRNWPTSTKAAAAEYKIWLTDLDGIRREITCNGELPLQEIAATHPVFADVTPQNEVYPGIYEKAYADITPGIEDSPVQSHGNLRNPDVSVLTSGDPLLALRAISGGKYSFDGVDMPNNAITAYYTVSPPGSPDTGIDIDDADNPRYTNFLNQFDSYGKVKNPMVAWTYYTGSDGINDATNRPDAPPDTYYVADWMVANHAYAVLGLKRLPPTPVNNPQYVILRNPFGPTYGGTPDMTNYDDNHDPTGIYKNAYLWRPLSTSTYTVNVGQTTSGTKIKPDGIFAMKLEQFLKYFEAVGWCIESVIDP